MQMKNQKRQVTNLGIEVIEYTASNGMIAIKMKEIKKVRRIKLERKN